MKAESILILPSLWHQFISLTGHIDIWVCNAALSLIPLLTQSRTLSFSEYSIHIHRTPSLKGLFWIDSEQALPPVDQEHQFTLSQSTGLEVSGYNLSCFLSRPHGRTAVISKYILHFFHQQLVVWFINSLNKWQDPILALWFMEHWFFCCIEASRCFWNHLHKLQ